MDFKQMLNDLNKSVDLNGEEKSIFWALFIDSCIKNNVCSFYKNKVFLIIPQKAGIIFEYLDDFDLLPEVTIPFDFSSVEEVAEELNDCFILCYDIDEGIGIPLFSVAIPIFLSLDETNLQQLEVFDKLIEIYDDYIEEQIKNDTTLIIEDDNDK